MIKKLASNNTNKLNPTNKEHQSRIFGKDLKNIVVAYHNKLTSSNAKARKPSYAQIQQNKKNKLPHRNNSQALIKSTENNNKYNNVTETKKSLGQSTEASPKQSQAKKYLKSKAPRVISQISKDLQITIQMRQLVIGWLVQIVNKVPLKNQVLFHSVILLDSIIGDQTSFLQSQFIVCIQNLQLIAVTCLFISAKYQQIYPPNVDFLVKLCDYTYSRKKIIQMQAQILLIKQFNLTFPTRYTFLQQAIHQQNRIQANLLKRVEHMSLFLLELSLLNLWDNSTQQQIAQAVLFLAKKIIKVPVQAVCSKTYKLVWKLIKIWKQRQNTQVYRIFDSQKYSFVGGLYLQEI